MQQTEELTTEAVAQRYGDAWNANDLDAIMALQADDMVFQLHAEGFEPAVGAETIRAQFAYFLEAWSELRFDTRELRVAGEVVTNEYRFSAELVKPFPLQGEVLEPNGARIEVDGVDVITVRDGLVRSKHTYLDTRAMAAAAADTEAADLVARFTEAWSRMDPDAFTPLFHPDVRLIHPIQPNTRGVGEAREFMKRTMSVAPDLRYDVQGWASGSGHVIIWGRLHGTTGGGPIEWPLVDRIKAEDGLIRERIAYFDPLPVIGTVLKRPRAWLPFVRSQARRLTR